MTRSIPLISLDAYRRAVALRDLTDPNQGRHALQLLVDAAVDALNGIWHVSTALRRCNPVVPVEDNYDRLGYPADGAARDARYTRYVSERLLLRTQTSAMVPDSLGRLPITDEEPDWLVACPGIVYRRDEIDRLHSGEPHQLDLWRVRRGTPLGERDLQEMIATLVAALLPGAEHRTLAATHPYTLAGRQIDVKVGQAWIEIGECGLAHPAVLTRAGLSCPPHCGLAMGLGLDRILMLRKGVPDIRLLRSTDPRVASQMQDLEPYRAVSHMPAVVRDLSVMVPEGTSPEELGDRVRSALGADERSVETVEVRAETAYADLPQAAITRMGAMPGQKNVLLRVVLRDLERTLTHDQANQLRNLIYEALHEGRRKELARTSAR